MEVNEYIFLMQFAIDYCNCYSLGRSIADLLQDCHTHNYWHKHFNEPLPYNWDSWVDQQLGIIIFSFCSSYAN